MSGPSERADVAFLVVKEPATRLGVDDEFAEMETVKVTQTIPSPAAGTDARA